ncbi:MAG: hypothetical protein ACXWLQ_05115 [Rhizomicrobium sp.]
MSFTGASCGEDAGVGRRSAFCARGRVLAPLFAVELFLLSIGCAGAVEMIATSPASKEVSQAAICSFELHRVRGFSPTLTQVNMIISHLREVEKRLENSFWRGGNYETGNAN